VDTGAYRRKQKRRAGQVLPVRFNGVIVTVAEGFPVTARPPGPSDQNGFVWDQEASAALGPVNPQTGAPRIGVLHIQAGVKQAMALLRPDPV
jgi:hypothetical protein